nr:hypothetical protein BDOA9_0163880 [Bradyrhizobium sp. DOA9]
MRRTAGAYSRGMAADRICMGQSRRWPRRSTTDLPLQPPCRAKIVQVPDVRRQRRFPGQEMIDPRHRALLLLRPPGRQRPRLADGGDRVCAKIIVGVRHGSMLCSLWRCRGLTDQRCGGSLGSQIVHSCPGRSAARP